MKRLFFSLTFLCFFAAALTAQDNRVDVVVHMKDGSKVEGMMTANPNMPWATQKVIAVFDKSLKDEKRIKNGDKTKYKANAIKGYEAEGKHYVSKKLMIEGRGDHSSTLKGMPAYALVERITEGPITVYKAYGYPPSVVSGISYEEVYEDLRQNPEYFMMKASEGKVKSMHNIDIAKWIEDAPETAQKFADGEFGNMKRKEGKKLGNFLKAQTENESPSLIVKVVEAYNAEIAK